MDNDYSVENLVKRFEKHMELFRQQKAQWEKDNPGKKFGEDYPDGDFSISEALRNICKEIDQIKKQRVSE